MSVRSLWRWTAVLAVAGVLTAGCGSSSKSSSDNSSDTSAKSTESTTKGSGSAANTASATGVTADTIKIAYSYPDLEALAKTGLIKVEAGPVDQIIKVLVDDVNARGGINGRKLDLTVAKFGVLAAAEQTAACTQFTEDKKVFAVLGGFLGDNNLCVTQQHSTALVSEYGTGFNQDLLDKARAPWVTPNASDERALGALVEVLDQQGSLKGKTIGVEAQTSNAKAFVDLAVKALEDKGYKVVETAVIDAPASDAQAFNAQDKLLAQRFKDKGVDTFFLLGGAPTGANYDAVDWHPSIYVPQTGLITPGAYTNPYEKFPLIAGLSATDDPDAGYNTPEMKRCREVYKKATGIEVKTAAEETADGKSSGNSGLSQACTALQIFVAGAEAAGANLTQETWLKGLESVGKIELPSAPVASFGPNKPDGQDSFQLQKHDPAWKAGSTDPEFISIGEPITFTQ